MSTLLKAFQFCVRETIWLGVILWCEVAYLVECLGEWMKRQFTKRVLGG